MPNLLIIDDIFKMTKLIQTQMSTINKKFKDSSFGLASRDGKIIIENINDIRDDESNLLLKNQEDSVLSSIKSFLNEHNGTPTLVIIDVLLISPNSSSPTYERYKLDCEYSCDIYAELLQIKNGKKEEGFKNINEENLYVIICSRSDASLNIVARALKDIFYLMSPEEKQYFPIECTAFENISWCNNNGDGNNTDSSKARIDYPIALPDSYEEFIKKL